MSLSRNTLYYIYMFLYICCNKRFQISVHFYPSRWNHIIHTDVDVRNQPGCSAGYMTSKCFWLARILATYSYRMWTNLDYKRTPWMLRGTGYFCGKDWKWTRGISSYFLYIFLWTRFYFHALFCTRCFLCWDFA